MSKANPLAGLIGNYGDSDEESEDGVPGAMKGGFDPTVGRPVSSVMPSVAAMADTSGTIHPAPIPHCPWSACYDESSGFTYYWNQQTNAVTWEAPAEYLLALKLAQQQLHSAGSTEVSAEEWQLYQQALAEKQNSQNKIIAKTPVQKSVKKNDKPVVENKDKRNVKAKRPSSDDEEEKIELITSYYHSDSDSNDETESPVKVKSAAPPPHVNKLPKNPAKKQKTKPPVVGPVLEYGPSLPPNQNYSMAIGPELPPVATAGSNVKKSPENKSEKPVVKEEDKKTVKQNEPEEDESSLLTKLKDKAKLLEKLGGEIPTDLQKIIQDEPISRNSPARTEEISKDSIIDTNIDDLLQEIEKKELPKIKSKGKIDMFGEENYKSKESSARNSPRSIGDRTPPLEEFKPLFPSSKNVVEPEKPVSLFPSTTNVQENGIDAKPKSETPPLVEKKAANMYLMDSNEVIENPNRKKLRISNSVLPERKKTELPSYTTKYSQFIEGFSSERTGLGFSKEEDEIDSPRNTISYGNGLTFTKGEILNEDKKDEALDDLTDLVEAKLKYLNQLQPCIITPVQEMLIQMQTLVSAFRAGALTSSYWRRWAEAGAASLAQHEACAAPPGWTCSFQRSEGRYRYRRIADGLTQWEYPASQQMDMDICTTPPHISSDGKEELPNPPLPPSPPPPPPAPPSPASTTPPPPPSHSRSLGATPPPPPSRLRVVTPPPPMWHDPPPPGCDDVPPPPPPPPPPPAELPAAEIGDELLSFYNDIAELEKGSSGPHTAQNSPEPPPPPPELKEREWDRERARSKEKDGKEGKISKKKTKVKISSSIGMKHKSVSNLVAKWQQVAEEINSD